MILFHFGSWHCTSNAPDRKNMQIRSRDKKQKKPQSQNRCCTFCNTGRLSASSSSLESSDEVQTVSSIAHAMVQERLDEMIRERRSRRARHEEMKMVVMVAMEKCSYDPREDFRESIQHVIVVNKIQEIRDLRQLLNYYLLMNSEEFTMTILEARIELGRGAKTIVDILRERMDGVDRAVRRPSLKERLGLKRLSCCGPTWGLGPTTMSVREEEDDDGADGPPPLTPQIEATRNPIQNGPIPPCVVQSSGMNLAAALAAERQLRAELDGGMADRYEYEAEGSPSRVSLMKLLEETMEGCDGEMKDWGGCDSVCCVCMGRKKGAAFIPCGHTFCRVCSREMWLNRGCCPLCNRSILEILDIY